MLRFSVFFFVLAVFAALLGHPGAGGMLAGIAKFFTLFSLVIFLAKFFFGLFEKA